MLSSKFQTRHRLTSLSREKTVTKKQPVKHGGCMHCTGTKKDVLERAACVGQFPIAVVQSKSLPRLATEIPAPLSSSLPHSHTLSHKWQQQACSAQARSRSLPWSKISDKTQAGLPGVREFMFSLFFYFFFLRT